jgi:hypothetical protein
MSAVRVFLHDLAWSVDPAGFLKRFDRSLSLAARHGIRTLPVLFDDCWHPDPSPGPQADPVPGVHNSQWVQSPGVRAALDPACKARLRAYVQGVIAARLAGSMLALYLRPIPTLTLLRTAFAWARESAPSQPFMSLVCFPYLRLNRELTGPSDIVSFHDVLRPDGTAFDEAEVAAIRRETAAARSARP